MIAVAAAEEPDNACGLAVVAAPKADKFEFVGNRLCETEGSLDGFSAAREQLDVRDAFGQQLAYQLKKVCTGVGRKAAKSKTSELFAQTFDVIRMAVADAANRDTGNEIEIFISVYVDNGAATGTVDDDLRIERDRLQTRCHCLGFFLEHRFGLRARHDAALTRVLRHRSDGMRRDIVQASTPHRSHAPRLSLKSPH